MCQNIWETHEETQALGYESLWSQDLTVTISLQQGCSQPALWSLYTGLRAPPSSSRTSP